ncbi:flagellar hook-basal body complex protein [Chromatiaceae bacterium AAb-1]|nr:flagellar hook-basal body complex protein [Chromatiaceae bacterium AAb-1]
MSMFNIGLSGLNTTQKALEVTSHNIANSSTAGYKTASSEFASVYNGGQRGGVMLSGVNENFTTQGNIVNTGSSLDLAITGKGFFVISENGRTAYTQAGQFKLDNEQYIENTHGNRLQGYGVDANENLIPGILTDLRIEAANIPAQATERIDFSLNLSGASEALGLPTGNFNPKDGDAYNFSQSSEIFDSLGNAHTLTQYFSHLGGNEWAVTYYVDGNPLPAGSLAGGNGTPNNIQPITALDADNNPVAAESIIITFGTDGQLTPITDGVLGANPPDNNKDDPYNVRELVINFAPAGADPMAVTVDMAKATQFGSGFSMYQNKPDGYTSGEFAGVAVAEDGRVYATFTNGATKLQGQVVLASFANVNGLENGNNTSWYATAASGAALYGAPAEGSFGSLLSGAYMGSNVNISEQLVDLMSFQQNYQANAKTISTADEMMQILFSAT